MLIRAAPITLAAALLLLVPNARGAFMPIAFPHAAYTRTTTPLNITQPANTQVSALSDGLETVTFDTPMAVTDSGSWRNGPLAAPGNVRALQTSDFAFLSYPEVTLTLSNPATTFGMEVLPGSGVYHPSAAFYSGDLYLGAMDAGRALDSACLFAATSDRPITSIHLYGDAWMRGSGGRLTIANLRYAPTVAAVPEPATLALLGAGLLPLLRRRRR